MWWNSANLFYLVSAVLIVAVLISYGAIQFRSGYQSGYWAAESDARRLTDKDNGKVGRIITVWGYLNDEKRTYTIVLDAHSFDPKVVVCTLRRGLQLGEAVVVQNGVTVPIGESESVPVGMRG